LEVLRGGRREEKWSLIEFRRRGRDHQKMKEKVERAEKVSTYFFVEMKNDFLSAAEKEGDHARFSGGPSTYALGDRKGAHSGKEAHGLTWE